MILAGVILTLLHRQTTMHSTATCRLHTVMFSLLVSKLVI
jgi:hypothetical protein